VTAIVQVIHVVPGDNYRIDPRKIPVGTTCLHDRQKIVLHNALAEEVETHGHPEGITVNPTLYVQEKEREDYHVEKPVVNDEYQIFEPGLGERESIPLVSRII